MSEEKANAFQYTLRNDPAEVAQYFQIENGELLSDIERQAGLDIMAEFQKKLHDLDFFMKKEYMIFNSKVNKCLLNRCYQNIQKPRAEARACMRECSDGIKNADNFVKSRFDLFTTSFTTCITDAQKPGKNAMQEVFECYDTMLNTFDSLKRDIKNEFSFYE